MKEVNKKITSSIIMLFVASMVLSLLLGAVAAKVKETKKKCVDYELIAFLGPAEVTYTDFSGAPELIIAEGFRLVGSDYNVTVTIDGIAYVYPEDFIYNEFWHLEYNAVTLEAKWEVEVILTFNLPGNPTITDWCVSQGTNVGYPDQVSEGTFVLSGTGIFDKVKGEGLEESWFGVEIIFFCTSCWAIERMARYSMS